MKIIDSIEEWQSIREKLPSNQTLGFVPTMGNLHDGHASLLKQAKLENDHVVLSLFVNAHQFNDPDDFARYPRTLENDIALAQSFNVDWVFLPKHDSLYQDGYQCQVREEPISNQLEGKSRSGHFNGVLTVVMKLFGLVRPNRAYFGEKDYQQLYLIRKMTTSFFLNIDIIGCPTQRNEKMLALSSRNNLLSDSEKALAEQVATLFHTFTEPESFRAAIEKLPITLHYFEQWQDRYLLAYQVNQIRLIDNRILFPV